MKKLSEPSTGAMLAMAETVDHEALQPGIGYTNSQER